MAKVKITGHASGTGVITVTAPNTSTDRTITLPDGTGTLLNSDGSGVNLTGITLANRTDATVSTSNPTISINPSAVGHLWMNSTTGDTFVCTTATLGANIWTNVGNGSTNVQPFAATGGTAGTLAYIIEYVVN